MICVSIDGIRPLAFSSDFIKGRGIRCRKKRSNQTLLVLGCFQRNNFLRKLCLGSVEGSLLVTRIDRRLQSDPDAENPQIVTKLNHSTLYLDDGIADQKLSKVHLLISCGVCHHFGTTLNHSYHT
eukprot:GHVO01065078.1.p1 GENE.GHVO01065078.1~~GHVO01065078.1.p1  ORF type:complete len:125 (+),score=8.61 GHVO01065078.1:500-874(+)